MVIARLDKLLLSRSCPNSPWCSWFWCEPWAPYRLRHTSSKYYFISSVLFGESRRCGLFLSRGVLFMVSDVTAQFIRASKCNKAERAYRIGSGSWRRRWCPKILKYRFFYATCWLGYVPGWRMEASGGYAADFADWRSAAILLCWRRVFIFYADLLFSLLFSEKNLSWQTPNFFTGWNIWCI